MSIESPENRITQREISPEIKKQIVNFWFKNILIEEQDLEEGEDVGEQLYKSLINDTSKLIDHWNLSPSNILLGKINGERDIERKSEAELEYIKIIKKLVDGFIDQNAHKSILNNDRWNTYPRAMKESKKFNCLGAALIGEVLLSKAGVERYFGHPPGHVVNILKTANGRWWYLDLRNKILTEINPERFQEEGQEFMRIKNPQIEYELLHLAPQKSVPAAIFGNFSAFLSEKEKDGNKDSTIYQIADQIEEINPEDIELKLFPERLITDRVLENEDRAMTLVRVLKKVVREFWNSLDPKIANLSQKRIKIDPEGFINFVVGTNDNFEDPPLIELRDRIQNELNIISSQNPEILDDVVQRFSRLVRMSIKSSKFD